MFDLAINNIALLCTATPQGILRQRKVSIGIKDGNICAIERYPLEGEQNIDAQGLIALPGLIDAHTHSIWGGSRAQEFARRLSGVPYTQILEEGGGILSTVAHTRQKSAQELKAIAQERVNHMIRQGITTVEIKSGYGLNPQTECLLLRVAKQLKGPNITTTFLGAHTVPKEHRAARTHYIDEIISTQLPLCAPFADSIDVYCDRGAFTLDESIAILKAGQEYGLNIKAHAEQVSHTGIAREASKLGALSVDHLEHAQESDIEAMAKHNTTAVLLPGAQLYLKDPPPPVAALREAGVPMAVASDLNPGTSPIYNIWLTATLSCLLQGLTMEEAFVGITLSGARALGFFDRGRLTVGYRGDIALFQPPPGDPIELESLLQSMGHTHCQMTIKGGHVIYCSQQFSHHV